VEVDLLALKLLLAPILIATASLVTRRWGPRVGGWLVSLPLTSSPVLIILAIEHGPAFSADAAVGSLAGLGANAAFGLAYVYAARQGPLAGIAIATPAFILAGAMFEPTLSGPAWEVAVLAITAIAVALRLLPPGSRRRAVARRPRWDIPARMLVAVVLVFTLTTFAPILGPQVSGLIATYPVYASVMSTFTQREAGLPAAIELVRGHLTGLFGTVAFFAVLIVALVPAGIAPAFLLAVIAALATQAVAFRTIPSRLVPEPA
jgi:hypothetical protein